MSVEKDKLAAAKAEVEAEEPKLTIPAHVYKVFAQLQTQTGAGSMTVSNEALVQCAEYAMALNDRLTAKKATTMYFATAPGKDQVMP